jgi:nucleotide-binding universal stress UspA family protein
MTKSIQRILCSIDLSDYSAPVLDYGSEMAQRFGAQLLIFHTIASDDNRLYGPDILDRHGKHARLAAEAHAWIKERMAACKVSWEAVVVSGSPVEQIRRVGLDRGVDLAIAASRGFSGLKRAFWGSVVERMARSLPFPFLVLPPPGSLSRGNHSIPVEFKRVVVGCNLSGDATALVDMAVTLGNVYESAVHLLHAVETPLNEKVVESTRAPYTQVQEDLLETLKKQLDELIPSYDKNRCTVKPTLIPGVPGEGLLTFSASVDANLIIVGVLHHSALGKILIGSTTEAALRHATCPALVVPLAQPTATPRSHD